MKETKTYTIEKSVAADFANKVEQESVKRNIIKEKKYNSSSKLQQLMELYILKGEKIFNK